MSVPTPSRDAPRWPEAISELMARVRDPASPAWDHARRDLWLLLHGALTRSLDRQAGHASREDLDDLAAAKSLDLLLKAESGKWEVTGRSGAEIAGYLNTVARNALVDWHRHRQREIPLARMPGAEHANPMDDTRVTEPHAEPPQWEAVAARQYAGDLVRCADTLAPRSRWAWFLRSFYDLPTRVIAGHPAVQLKPAHVDVVLQRCRQAIRNCMELRGHTTAALPPGTFVELWSHLRSVRPELFEGPHEEGVDDPS